MKNCLDSAPRTEKYINNFVCRQAMDIKDVQANKGNIEVVAEVVRKESTRTFEKFGKKGKVCNCLVKDASGQITLTLWNEDVDKVNEGDRIKVENGWCSEYKGQKQLSAGKFGKIEIVEKKSSPAGPAIFTNDPAQFQEATSEEEEESPEVPEEEFEE